MKKLLVAIVAISMIVCAMGLTAFADGNEAQIGAVPYGTVEEAVEAAENGSVIELLTNAQIEKRLTIDKALTIDGKNNTITVKGDSRCIDIVNDAGNATVTIKNLTVTEDASNGLFERGINYNATGVLNLENVNVEGLPTYALNLPGKADNAVVNITNCNLKGFSALNIWGTDTAVNVTDSILHGHNTIEETENVTANTSAVIYLNNDTVNIADGTIVTITGGEIIASRETETCYGVYIVVNSSATGEVRISDATNVTKIDESEPTIRESVARIGDALLLDLADAFDYAKDGDTILLIRDVTVDDMLKVEGNKNITLDLNGYTITAGSLPEGRNFVLYITTGDTVTIKDSVEGGGIVNNTQFGYAILNQGALVVNGGTFVGDMALWNGYDTINSTATINGGTFSFNNAGGAEAGYSVGNSGTLIINDGVTINDWMDTHGALTVAGGTIENIFVHSGSESVAARTTTVTGGTIGALEVDEKTTNVVSVSGGTFSSDVSAFCKDGYEAVLNADGSYGVVVSKPWTISADGGKNEAATEATIVFNAFYKDWATKDVETFGMYVYKQSNKLGKKVVVSQNAATTLKDAEGLFNTQITGIPASDFDTVIVCIPYVVVDNSIIAGDAKVVTAAQFTKVIAD